MVGCTVYPFYVSELLFKFMQAIAIYNGEIYNSRQVPSCVFIRAASWDYALSRYLPDLVSDTYTDQMVSPSLKTDTLSTVSTQC